MSVKSAHLTLRPGRCNQCGRCVSACPNDAIRVGADYLLVDWHACNQCCACVEACDQKAIERTVVPLRSSSAVASVAPADVTRVVVGSRAEAKAVRRAAEQAAKQAGRGAARPAPAASRVAAAAGSASAGGATAAPRPRTRPTDGPAGRTATPARPVAATPAAVAPASAPWHVLGATWTPADAFALLAVLLVTLVGKNALLALRAVALMPAAGRTFTRVGVLGIYYAVQVGALVLLAGRHGCTFADAFGLKRTGDDESRPAATERSSVAASAGLTIALLLGVEVVAIAYGLMAQAVGWKQPITLSADVSTVFGGGGLGLLLSVLLVALIAPIAEELAFRGVILASLGDRWGAWPAIAISAVLFAAYHVNLWLFVPMLALGGALGWLTVERRSLWPAIALHVLYNSVAIAAAFIVPR